MREYQSTNCVGYDKLPFHERYAKLRKHFRQMNHAYSKLNNVSAFPVFCLYTDNYMICFRQ